MIGAFILAVAAAAGETPAVRYVGHATPESPAVIERFAGVLEPGIEYHAIVEMEKGGTFEIVLYPETAPNHAASFVALARAGFYDGVTFHRVLDGFMAQGGDPTGTGGGGPGYTLPAEFSTLPHVRGAVSAARAGDPQERTGAMPRPPFAHSAGSQFFVMFTRYPSLDGRYTVFGHVVRGMDVVDRIRRRDPDENPDFIGDAIRSVRIVEARPPRGTRRRSR